MPLSLPFEKYTIKSTKSLKQLHSVIDENCEARRLLLDPNQTLKPFFGSRIGNTFKIEKAMHKRNSFSPLAVGLISEEKLNKESIDKKGFSKKNTSKKNHNEKKPKTSIDVTLRMNYSVIIFTAIWAIFFLAVGIAFLFKEKSFMVLVPAAMLFLGYRMMNKAFWSEAEATKKLIQSLAD